MLDANNRVIMTFADVEKLSAEIAGVLLANGLVKGDRVVAQIEKSPFNVALYLACLRQGVIFIPLNTAYKSAELEYFLTDSAAKLLVCAPDKLRELQPLARQCGINHVLTADIHGRGSLQKSCSEHTPDRTVRMMAESDVAAILYTSGTTGAAKGAMLTHGNLASNVKALHQIWGWKSEDVLLHTLPIFHAHGLFVGVHLSLFNASSMIFMPRFEPDQVIDLLPEATVFMGVPTFYNRLIMNKRLSPEHCSKIRLFISGSAPLRLEEFEAFRARTGHCILERYGMTEALMITSNPLTGERVPGSVGYPLPGVSVRVVSKSGTELASEEIGQLQIRGPNVFSGYWRNPEKTQEEFTEDGYFRTGDLCTKSNDGRISIVGRDKDMIISGGYNIYPSEIEKRIMEVGGVVDCAVFGLPNADFGECVAAVIVAEKPNAVTVDSVVEHLRTLLAGFKQPRKIFFRDALPRNAMGKVVKAELRAIYENDCPR